jgi:glycosyltransferase involved in cell wall biosynthesis
MLPRAFPKILNLRRINRRRFLTQLRTTVAGFHQARHNHPGTIFVFPFYHTGGAERVHASIIEAVADPHSICLITSPSSNTVFRDRFAAHSRVLEVDELLKLDVTRSWITRKLQTLCHQNPNITLFGCNSHFFYHLLPHLPATTTAIDLLHAFVHAHEVGPEKWSLPHVPRLTHRVVINQQTKADFSKLYQANAIPLALAERILVIPNFVEVPASTLAKDGSNFRVTYVGRGSAEKRIHLIAAAAARVRALNPTVQFHFVGDVKAAIPPDLEPQCIVHGEINVDAELNALYDRSHVIIIASSREGFPMVLMEGMSRGAVPISTAVGGIPEHIIHEKNGLLINTTDEPEIIESFSQHILNLSRNPSTWERLSVASRSYALHHFTRGSFNAKYQSILAPKTKR